jgi:hypothetical protein
MSFSRALPTLRQSTRALARPISLKSVPHSTPSSLRFSPSTSAARPFSSSVAQWRYSSVANDPKWQKGEKVTYDELKPITQSPDNVRPYFATSLYPIQDRIGAEN